MFSMNCNQRQNSSSIELWRMIGRRNWLTPDWNADGFGCITGSTEGARGVDQGSVQQRRGADLDYARVVEGDCRSDWRRSLAAGIDDRSLYLSKANCCVSGRRGRC